MVAEIYCLIIITITIIIRLLKCHHVVYLHLVCIFYFLLQLIVFGSVTTNVVGFTTSESWWKVLMVEGCVTMVLCLAALGTSNIPRKGYIILQSIPVGVAAGVGTMTAVSTH